MGALPILGWLNGEPKHRRGLALFQQAIGLSLLFRVTTEGLPPGEYLAVAVDYVELGEGQDPTFLDSVRDLATPLTLGPGLMSLGMLGAVAALLTKSKRIRERTERVYAGVRDRLAPHQLDAAAEHELQALARAVSEALAERSDEHLVDEDGPVISKARLACLSL